MSRCSLQIYNIAILTLAATIGICGTGDMAGIVVDAFLLPTFCRLNQMLHVERIGDKVRTNYTIDGDLCWSEYMIAWEKMM